MKTFKLTIISKDRKIEKNATQIVVNTENGQLTILANHIPFITTIVEGNSEWSADNKREKVFLKNGIMKVDREQVMIFADFD